MGGIGKRGGGLRKGRLVENAVKRKGIGKTLLKEKSPRAREREDLEKKGNKI